MTTIDSGNGKVASDSMFVEVDFDPGEERSQEPTGQQSSLPHDVMLAD